jgi:hypothetical protein
MKRAILKLLQGIGYTILFGVLAWFQTILFPALSGVEVWRTSLFWIITLCIIYCGRKSYEIFIYFIGGGKK